MRVNPLIMMINGTVKLGYESNSIDYDDKWNCKPLI